MKKLLLFILLSSGVLCSYAQPNDFFNRFKGKPTPGQASGRQKIPRSLPDQEKGLLPFLKLDSIVIVNDIKFTFTYTADKKILEFVEYNWDTVGNNWVPIFGELHNDNLNDYSITQYKWDSTTSAWVLTYYLIFIYNSTHEIIQGSYFEWDPIASEWRGVDRYFLIDTPTSSVTISETWNISTNDWQPFLKQHIVLNENGDPIEQTQYTWVDNAWEVINNSGRGVYSYDANGNLTEAIITRWNADTQTWVNDTRYNRSYNAMNKILDDAIYQWETSNNTWTGMDRFVYNYNQDEVVLTSDSYGWEHLSNNWRALYRQAYFYNSDATLAKIDIYDFDESLTEWVLERPHSAYTYAYTPQGELSEKIEMRWLHAVSNIINYRRQNYTYDLAGNVTDYLDYNWNNVIESWYGVSREIKAYDLTVDVADLVYAVAFLSGPLFENAKLVSQQNYSFDIEFNDWQLDSDTYYYFSEFITATNEANAAESLKLFPNPVSNLLTPGANAPRASSYQITDLNGRILQHEKSWNGDGIDVSRLIPGSYVIRLMEGNRVITGKFIKS